MFHFTSLRRFPVVLAATAAVCLSSAAHDRQTSIPITEIAPESSYLVVGVDRFEESWNSFKSTSLYELWRTPEMQQFLERPVKESWAVIGELLGLDPESVSRDEIIIPTGAAGFSLYMPPEPGDGTIAVDQPHLYFVAEFGDQQEAGLEEKIQHILVKVRESDQYEVTESEAAGRTVYSIAENPDDPAEIDARRSEYIDWYRRNYPDEEVPSWINDMDFGSGPKYRASFTLDGARLIYATDYSVVEDSLLTVDGIERSTVSSNEALEQALAMVGGRGDIYAVVLVDPLMKMLASGEAAGIGEVIPGGIEVMTALGITDVKAGAINVELAPADAITRSRGAIFVPEGPRGLFDLFVNRDAALTMPEWVDPGIVSCARLNFDFAGIVPLIRKTIDAMPEESRAEASQQFETTLAALFTAVFEQMGPEVRLVNWPLSGSPVGESEMAIPDVPFAAAIACNDEQIVQNALAPYFGLGQLTPRDFLNYRIYELPDELNSPVALGFGKSTMFVGQTARIESAFRAQADSPQLAQDVDFRRAVSAIPTANVFFSYLNTTLYMRQIVDSLRNSLTMMEEQLSVRPGESGEGEDGAFLPDTEFYGPLAWLESSKAPDADFISRFLGDVVGHMVKTDNGLIFESRMHLPSK